MLGSKGKAAATALGLGGHKGGGGGVGGGAAAGGYYQIMTKN